MAKLPKEETFGFFPVRGLEPARYDLRQIWERPWSIVSVSQVDDLDRLLIDGGGFGGNLQAITDRLRPSAFLVVKRYLDRNLEEAEWQEARKSATSLVAALNFCLLASVDTRRLRMDEDHDPPSPVWIPTYRESEDNLAMIANRHRVLGGGGNVYSSPLSWGFLTGVDGDPLSNAKLDALLAEAPTFVQELGKSTLRSTRIANTLTSLSECFNCTTVGQFCAQAVGTLEIVFDEAIPTDSKEVLTFKETKDLVHALTGHKYRKSIEATFQTRNDFVHRHKQSGDALAHIKALALVVTTIRDFVECEKKYGDPLAARRVLEATSKLHFAEEKAKAHELKTVRESIYSAGQLPGWSRRWLKPDGYIEESNWR